LWFTNEYDHAKWALAYNGGQTPPAKWFCAADMNRMSSQRKRGGGALCTIDDEMWDAMERIITKYDTACEN
jgi:deoxyribonuclease-2